MAQASLDLDLIEQRAQRVRENGVLFESNDCKTALGEDIPALVAEVKRLRAMTQNAGSLPPKTPVVGESLLRNAGEPLPAGCYCKPGQCMAPKIMGHQTACRDPEKAALPAPAQGGE